jgi:hypothetical protein
MIIQEEQNSIFSANIRPDEISSQHNYHDTNNSEYAMAPNRIIMT